MYKELNLSCEKYLLYLKFKSLMVLKILPKIYFSFRINIELWKTDSPALQVPEAILIQVYFYNHNISDLAVLEVYRLQQQQQEFKLIICYCKKNLEDYNYLLNTIKMSFDYLIFM